MNPLAQLAIQELPTLIGYLKVLFTKQNPGVPAPTSDAIIAAYNEAFAVSIAKDEAIIAAHPV